MKVSLPSKFEKKRLTFEYPTDLMAVSSYLAVCTAWVQHKKCNISTISEPFGEILGVFERYSSPLVDRIGLQTKDSNGGI